MKKRLMAAGMVMALTAGLLAGCSGGSDSSGETEKSNSLGLGRRVQYPDYGRGGQAVRGEP